MNDPRQAADERLRLSKLEMNAASPVVEEAAPFAADAIAAAAVDEFDG